MAIERVLAPIDGSDVANRALDFAVERAKLHGASVTVAFAVNRLSIAIATANPYGYTDPTPLLEALDEEAEAVLSAGEARVKQAGVAVERAKLEGLAAPAILTHARSMRADIIVVGTHGRRGFDRFAVGSTAEGVIRAASVPVFVVPQRAATQNPGALGRAVVAVDGSPAADLGLAFACELARDEHTHVTVCSVAESAGMHWEDLDRSVLLEREMEEKVARLLDERKKRAQSLGVEADTKLLRGDAAVAIVSLAAAEKADCIVVGTHGRAGIPRFVLGSVAEGILRSSSVPVCTLRHK